MELLRITANPGSFTLLLCSFLCLTAGAHAKGFFNFTVVDPAVAESKGAVCLDGSPPAYAFQPGNGTGIDKWIIYVEGGAWCDTPDDCLARQTYANGLGSSRFVNRSFMANFLDHNPLYNPDFYGWNKVVFHYCDGGSFLGDVEEVDPVKKVMYRGLRIFDLLVDQMMEKGMNNAKEAILSGGSAGALTTILHCDGFRGRLPNANRVKCIADAGFFIYGKNLAGAQERKDFYARVINTHGMMKSLPKACTSIMDPSLCLFPENLVEHVQTPLFIVESAFDSFAITNRYGPYVDPSSNWTDCATVDMNHCTPSQINDIRAFGMELKNAIRNLSPNPSRGIFVDNCVMHSHITYLDRWRCKFIYGSMTIEKMIGDWYYDRSPVQIIMEDNAPRNCTPSVPTAVLDQTCI